MNLKNPKREDYHLNHLQNMISRYKLRISEIKNNDEQSEKYRNRLYQDLGTLEWCQEIVEENRASYDTFRK